MSKRITEIEGIRGLLSLIVVGGHIYAPPVFWFAGCMEVFFCISGFVITRVLLEDGEKAGFLPKYFVRRALRIWPMYYLAMLFAYVVFFATDGVVRANLPVSPDWQLSFYSVLAPLFYIQNLELYFGLERQPYLLIFDHSWSVAMEEQYYVLWPLLLLFALRRWPVSVRWAFAAGCILLTIALRDHWRGLGPHHTWLLGARLDGFVLGSVLAYLERAVATGRVSLGLMQRVFRWLWVWPLLALTPFLARGYLAWYADVEVRIPAWLLRTICEWHFNFALLGFSIVGYCVFFRLSSGASLAIPLCNWKPLQHLGAISYSTYLLHLPIVYAVVPYLMQHYRLAPIMEAVLGYGLSLGLAQVTYTMVEAQAMRLKKRFSYASAAPAPAPAAPLAEARRA